MNNAESRTSPQKKRQRGAVVVYMAAMAAVLAMMVLFVYNTGHIANEKTRLQNTTDAAAHSVAVLQSRDFNFQAYSNRAMIANQVAIAQAISLVSWIRFVDNGIQTLNDWTGYFPYWGAIIQAVAQVSNAVKIGVEYGAGIFVDFEDAYIGMISASQRLMHEGILLDIPLTMQEVIRANDPGVDSGLITQSTLLAQLVAKHRDSLTQYDPDNVKNRNGSNWQEDKKRMDEFRDVTLRSRDGFSASRTYKLMELPVPDPSKVLKIEKAGGTELSGESTNSPYYTWAAMDTASVHTRRWKCKLSGCGYSSWRESMPLMWGAAQTGDDVYYSKLRGKNFGKTWKVNPISSTFDAAEFQDASAIGSFSGLRKFHDITQKGLLDTMPAVVVLLTKSQGGANGVRTARDIGFAKAGSNIDIEQRGGLANDRLHAMAKAEAYFSRPNDLWSRPQGGREYGNVYNPFWQARLIKLTAAERLVAVGLANIH